MNSAAFLLALETGLRPAIAAAGGRLDVASDPEHVLELLAAQGPAGWRVIMAFAGNEAVDPDTAPGVVVWNLSTTIQAAKGLNVDPGADAHKTKTNGREALLSLAAMVGRHIRGFSGNHPDLHESGFVHVSESWLEVEGLPTRQLTQIHRCIFALDPVIDTPCNFPA